MRIAKTRQDSVFLFEFFSAGGWEVFKTVGVCVTGHTTLHRTVVNCPEGAPRGERVNHLRSDW